MLLLWTTLFTLLLLYLSAHWSVHRMAFKPDRNSSLSANALPQHITEIVLHTSDGKRLPSYFSSTPTNKKVVLYFHGNGGNISKRLPTIHEFHKMGINCLCMGYRGYGKSTGIPTEKGIYRDGEAALTYLHNCGFCNENIFLYGRSLGTTVACELAQNQQFAGVILVTPLSSGIDFLRIIRLQWLRFILGNPFLSKEKIKKNRSPLLLIHGTADETIPYFMGELLYNNATSKKEMLTIPGAGHENLSTDFSTHFWPAIERFIKNCEENSQGEEA